MPPTPRKNNPPTPKPTPTASPAPAAAPSRSEVKGSGSPKAAAPAARQISQEQIAQRAFEIYAGRGYAPGDPSADWFEAERQLKAGL